MRILLFVTLMISVSSSPATYHTPQQFSAYQIWQSGWEAGYKLGYWDGWNERSCPPAN